MRFPLRALLLLMVWVGLVCLALRSPNPWWNGGMFDVLVLVWLTSILVAIYRSGPLRAMAIGFIVFGAGYLGIEGSSWPGSKAAVEMPTDDIVRWSYKSIHQKSWSRSDPYDQLSGDFKGIWSSTLALIVGLIGAMIAQTLYRTRPKEQSTQTPP